MHSAAQRSAALQHAQVRVAKKSASRAKITSFGLDYRYDTDLFSFLSFLFFFFFLPFFYRTYALCVCEREGGFVRVVTDQ